MSDSLPTAMTLSLLVRFLLYLLNGTVLIVALLAVRYLSESRPFIGGVDFYYYVLLARDLAAGVVDLPEIRYWYFPGVYSFWQIVLFVSDGSLASLQWAYVGVLLLNGGLIGIIIWNLTGLWQGSVLAAVIYIIEATRLEGLFGCTEPIVTVFYLAGLWGWILFTRRSQIEWGMLSLATGFGLALFTKQPGGLLALGAIGLIPALWSPPSVRIAIRHLALLPIAAGLIFLSAMMLEGGGLRALKIAFLFSQQYPVQGAWTEHLTTVARIAAPFSNLLLSGCIFWVAITTFGKRTSLVSHDVWLVLGLSIFSTLGGLLQFSRRGYLHYAMLVLPSAILASSLTIHIAARFFNGYAQRWPQFAVPVTIASVTGFLAVHSWGGVDFTRHIVREISSPTQWVRNEDIGMSFAPLCKQLRPGVTLLLVPPRENIIHWFCQTRSVAWKVKPDWERPDLTNYPPVISPPEIENVFVLSKDYGEYERRFFEEGDWEWFFQEMNRLGFRETLVLPSGRLYQKNLPAAKPHSTSDHFATSQPVQ